MAFELLSQPIETIERWRLEAFERAYARRSHVTVEWLHRVGWYVAPCDCGEGLCEGWRMGHQHEEALFMENRRVQGHDDWMVP